MNNKVGGKTKFQMNDVKRRETFVRVYELKRRSRHCEKIV